MEGNWFDSDVMEVPDFPIPYVCESERDKAEAYYAKPENKRGKPDFTTWWFTVLDQQGANEVQLNAVRLRESARGEAAVALAQTQQYHLARDKVTKICDFPDMKGNRRTVTDSEEKLHIFRRMPPFKFSEIYAAIQNWSVARAGLLGNVDCAPSGDSR